MMGPVGPSPPASGRVVGPDRCAAGRRGAGSRRPRRDETSRRNAMLDNSVLAGEIIRHGAYVCLRLADGADARALPALALPAPAGELRLGKEFGPRPAGPSGSVG